MRNVRKKIIEEESTQRKKRNEKSLEKDERLLLSVCEWGALKWWLLYPAGKVVVERVRVWRELSSVVLLLN